MIIGAAARTGIAGVAFAVALIGAAHGADIGCPADSEKCPGLVMITGEIVQGDYERFIEYLKQTGPKVATVALRSPGGDFLEAIRIGRTIRDLGMATIAAVNVAGGECASACSFIFYAGTLRLSDQGLIKVHRPYFDPSYFANLSRAEAEEQARKLYAVAMEYLDEMDVPQDVVEMMLSTPSTDLASAPAVPWTSPAYEEWLIAKCGGLSEADQQYAYRLEREEEEGASLSVADRRLVEVSRAIQLCRDQTADAHRAANWPQ